MLKGSNHDPDNLFPRHRDRKVSTDISRGNTRESRNTPLACSVIRTPQIFNFSLFSCLQEKDFLLGVVLGIVGAEDSGSSNSSFLFISFPESVKRLKFPLDYTCVQCATCSPF